MRLLVLASFAVMIGVLAWAGSDRLERRNEFCNACHLPGGTPLHIEVREDFDRVIPVNLAGVHGRGWIETREDSAFRCIDCHAGAGPLERTKVKLLAARDGVRYALGAFEEPDGMPFDLSPDVCRACHASFRGSAAPGWTVRSFHGHAEHDEGAAPACVTCHAVHSPGGDGMAYQMDRGRVDRTCRSCHAETGIGGPGIRGGG